MSPSCRSWGWVVVPILQMEKLVTSRWSHSLRGGPEIGSVWLPGLCPAVFFFQMKGNIFVTKKVPG